MVEGEWEGERRRREGGGGDQELGGRGSTVMEGPKGNVCTCTCTYDDGGKKPTCMYEE